MPYDPDLQPFVDAVMSVLPVSPENLTPLDYRAAVAQFVTDPPPRPDGIEVTDQTLTHDGIDVSVRIYRPVGADAQPCLIYFHGGGWLSGSIDSHDQLCLRFAMELPCTVINVGYRLIPEHPFPAAIEDSIAVIQATIAQAARLGVDPKQVFAAGDSAGANLIAGATIAMRDAGAASLSGQLLLYPATTTDFELPSFIENADVPFLSTPYVRWVWEHYLDGNLDTTDPRAVPLHAESHAGLPPAMVITANFDPLRDDGEAYADKLRDAGVDVTLRCAPRLIHGFIRATSISQDAEVEFQAACDWLRSRFAA